MSNIQKWTVPGYSCTLTGNRTPITSLGEVTVYIDFDKKQFQINLADGSTISGPYKALLSGSIYQAKGMFGFYIGKNYYLFGDNASFADGYLAYPASGTADMVWVSSQTVLSGPLLKSSSDTFYYTPSSKGEPVAAICYLAGTLILTPLGERAIETLQPGDEVLVRRAGTARPETIRWVGSAHQDVDAHETHDDRAGYPVRLRAHALGIGLPHRDLYITAEHCLYLDGCFVPARMLVNGDTIAYDRSKSRFDYFHIELETHGIILANGVESETYLDTGNRLVFAQSAIEGPTLRRLPETLSWAIHACAPLNVEPGFVRGLWERFAPASPKISVPARPTTTDPALHLARKDGTVLAPYRRNGQTYLFRLTAPLARIVCARVTPVPATRPAHSLMTVVNSACWSRLSCSGPAQAQPCFLSMTAPHRMTAGIVSAEMTGYGRPAMPNSDWMRRLLRVWATSSSR
ncbi:Hint domain-containing protein [Asaia krungthepensis]|uniref:Hedgehog/Intein (Hint) domain-containing protein n=1 Tax=Asaia krungthepensis NRIC 0535 TaxID=1307925 RepID=A0ABQ0Q0H8_9PROT|nr:Hint domain-containing protein [Asaia krungthepensis]GBQ86147.1 hypothetical protein AA0535_0945 [Asaia krungthepensis NRIC 0535]